MVFEMIGFGNGNQQKTSKFVNLVLISEIYASFLLVLRVVIIFMAVVTIVNVIVFI